MKMFRNISDALNWIMQQRKGEMEFSIFKDICAKIGNPQNNFKYIHVAGTNGKGSVVTYLRDLLMSQGYRVGTLQSPHYLTHLDRIRYNGQNIDDNYFLDIMNKNYDFYTSNGLGMFEIDYLIALEYFKEKNVDFVIVEVGIGGRLDSTNVVDNTLLSVITTIGLDHMEKLGDTLEKICYEKCGIIKDNSNVLIGYLEDNLKNIVKDNCQKHHCNYYETQEYLDLCNREFIYDDNKYKLLSYAKYQKNNASLALEAFKILSNLCNFEIDYLHAKDAINKTLWQGRFEIVNENPRVILDGAHNPHGIKALCDSFDLLKGKKCVIFSALKRKDYKTMCQMLKQHSDKLVVTSFDYNGSIDLNDIDNEYKDSDYVHAIKEAIKEYDNVLICGSLYFISEVAAHIESIVK